jgi:hypothetical protein
MLESSEKCRLLPEQVFAGITLSRHATWIERISGRIEEEERKLSEQDLKILTPFAKISLRKPVPVLRPRRSLR